MQKIDVEKIKENNFIFPIIFKKGLLFRDFETFYHFENHIITCLTYDEIKNEVESGSELLIPENDEEILLIKQGVDFVYNRILYSQFDDEIYHDFFNILKEMKVNQELYLKRIQKELL